MADDGLPGPKGDKGDKGEPGEAILVPVAEEMVARLVRGAQWSRRAVIVLGVVCIVLAGFLGAGAWNVHRTTQLVSAQQAEQKDLEKYVQQYAQHSCEALELLTATPVPKPADPAANPSREITYEFYEDLLYWERADGCTPPMK